MKKRFLESKKSLWKKSAKKKNYKKKNNIKKFILGKMNNFWKIFPKTKTNENLFIFPII